MQRSLSGQAGVDRAAISRPDGTLAEVAERLGADLQRGLTRAEAGRRLERDGPNEPAPIAAPSWFSIARHQVASKLIWILALATAVSLGLGEWLNAAAIGITVVFTTLIGFVNEFRSERAISALRDLTARRAEVEREGLLEEIAAHDVVTGDLLYVDEGDVVAADARVVESRGLRVNESILTGEPEAVSKDEEPEAGEEEPATPGNMVFAGTTVVAGSARVLVVATGPSTSLGSIFSAVERSERPPTPLEQRLDLLGNRLIVAFLVVTVLITGVGLLQGRDVRLVIETAVSLAIGAVPEGLPAVATIALAIAVRRLARVRVLVRRLNAVETLGSTTIIVTDKTGTLTENRMVLRSVVLGDGREVPAELAVAHDRIETTFRGPEGRVLGNNDRNDASRVLLLAALCNDAVVEHDAESGWHAHGDPSEGALALAARGLGYDGEKLAKEYPRIETEPFSSATRMMRTVHRTGDGRLEAIKGALEPVAHLSDQPDERLLTRVRELGDAGYRVMVVAERADAQGTILRGAVVLEDPIRGDAVAATTATRKAGVELMLVTGDQTTTAKTVATQTGILVDGMRVVPGSRLDLDDLEGVAAVSRAGHEQKEAIITSLQRSGQVVAMMGDGVNDAAALRSAHVGVAVGPGATDVAVEASDILLSDGRLLSFVQGIREGRQVTRSLRRAIVYLLTASFGTIGLIALAMVADLPLPLAALQILWLNIVVHVFPALALATSSEASSDPDAPTKGLLSNETWLDVGWRAAASALAPFGALVVANSALATLGEQQATVYLTIAAVLIGQSFLIGVESTRAQIERLRHRMLWGAVLVSAVLLVIAVYLPGLRPALNLDTPSGQAWAIAAVSTAAGLAASQVGTLLIGAFVRRRDGGSMVSPAA